MMAPKYIVHFAQLHSEFRLPELQSISELYGFKMIKPEQLPGDDNSDSLDLWDPLRPFWVISLEKEEHATLLAQRCILVKGIYEFYAKGSTYAEVHEQTRSCRHLYERFAANTSFRFTVSAYNHTISLRRQRDVVESFSFMDFQGPIDMKTPELICSVFEEYLDGIARKNDDDEKKPLQIYFGRLVAEGTARNLIQKFDVKKRAYFGNTSMEAEISLLMANQSLAAPGKFVYDPFVGTGSMLYTSAQFGAFVFGSDIDGRQMRGKEDEPGTRRAAAQYGVASRIIDLCTYDVTRNPFRCGELFDAILTDPPYGVRAGAKRLGRKPTDKRILKRRPEQEIAESKALMQYLPPTQPYELSSLVSDLVRYARYMLKPGGRLVFFLPTVTDEYAEVDVFAMLCEGMEVIANSVQDFGSWGRRLITIRKTTSEKFPSPFEPINDGASNQIDGGQCEGHIPAHKDFREKYFRGFRKGEGVGDGAERT